jgi:hypothetical protein
VGICALPDATFLSRIPGLAGEPLQSW